MKKHERILAQLRELSAWIEAYDQEMDAPGGDESQARPPEGDDYNEVVQHIRATLANLLEDKP